jgi:antitoxin MazE
MKTKVQKWDNSLALRIPKSFATEAGLSEATPVEISLVDRKLIVQPLNPETVDLDDLLRQVTDDNRHGEWNSGPAVGREIW